MDFLYENGRVIAAILFDVILSLIVAWRAANKGRNPIIFFCFNFFLSPLIALIVLLAMGEKPVEMQSNTVNPNEAKPVKILTPEELKAKWDFFKKTRNVSIPVSVIAFAFGIFVFSMTDRNAILSIIALLCGLFVAIAIPVSVSMTDEYKMRYNTASGAQ